MHSERASESDSWQRGDRVLAPWGNHWLYPGTIADVRNAAAAIRFDDGTSKSLPLSSLRQLDVSTGTKVHGKWKNGWFFYPGTVTERNGDAIFIEYDDGDTEWTTIGMIRIPANTKVAGGFGCAWLVFPSVISTGAFVIGSAATYVSSDEYAPHPLIAGAMIAATAFVATLILIARDQSRFTTTLGSVRRKLLDRPDVEDEEFCRAFLKVDSQLLIETRNAAAVFLDVPPQKLHPADHLNEDLQFESLEPDFQTSVVYQILARRNAKNGDFMFETGTLKDFGDLAAKIEGVLDDLGTDPGAEDS